MRWKLLWLMTLEARSTRECCPVDSHISFGGFNAITMISFRSAFVIWAGGGGGGDCVTAFSIIPLGEVQERGDSGSLLLLTLSIVLWCASGLQSYPMLFNIHLKALGEVIRCFALVYQYADDAQLCVTIRPPSYSKPPKLVSGKGNGTGNKLYLSLDKAEVLLVGSNLTLGIDIITMLDGVALPPKAYVSSLEINLDPALPLDDQVVVVGLLST